MNNKRYLNQRLNRTDIENDLIYTKKKSGARKLIESIKSDNNNKNGRDYFAPTPGEKFKGESGWVTRDAYFKAAKAHSDKYTKSEIRRKIRVKLRNLGANQANKSSMINVAIAEIEKQKFIINFYKTRLNNIERILRDIIEIKIKSTNKTGSKFIKENDPIEIKDARLSAIKDEIRCAKEFIQDRNRIKYPNPTISKSYNKWIIANVSKAADKAYDRIKDKDRLKEYHIPGITSKESNPKNSSQS